MVLFQMYALSCGSIINILTSISCPYLRLTGELPFKSEEERHRLVTRMEFAYSFGPSSYPFLSIEGKSFLVLLMFFGIVLLFFELFSERYCEPIDCRGPEQEVFHRPSSRSPLAPLLLLSPSSLSVFSCASCLSFSDDTPPISSSFSFFIFDKSFQEEETKHGT